MDAVGLAASVAGQLVVVCREINKIWGEMEDIGQSHNQLSFELRGAGLRLQQWEEAWKLQHSNDSLELQTGLLDPSNERHQHAVECLARIVDTFTKILELQSKYADKDDSAGSKGKGKEKEKWFNGLLQVPKLRSRSRSPSRDRSPSPQPSLEPLNPVDVGLVENPEILSNPQFLNDQLVSLSLAAECVQKSLPRYRKLGWAITDKEMVDILMRKLRSYLDDLFTVMPPPTAITGTTATTATTTTTATTATMSFHIPIALLGVPAKADIVERSDLLLQLEESINNETRKPVQVVLYGTGGMGKTHLALQYISSHSTTGKYSSAFFVNAASERTTKLAFAGIMQQLIKAYAQKSDTPTIDYFRIGQKLGMAGKLDPATGVFSAKEPQEEQHVIDAVKEWFTNEKNTKWLLVLDNVDDLSFDIDGYIPVSLYGGTVIITSRRPEIAGGRIGINVQQMHDDEAEKLLRISAKCKPGVDLSLKEQEDFMMIIEKLGNLPLALEQAGAYIYRRQYSFTRYLQEFEESIQHVLNSNGKSPGKRSVFATWELSFQAVHQENPEAANLLSLFGYLDNNDIPEELLQKGLKKDAMTLGSLLECLFSYSFIKRDRDDSFSLHPLVHQWTRYRLEHEAQWMQARKAFIMVTSMITVPKPERRGADWVFERRILPHLSATAKNFLEW